MALDERKDVAHIRHELFVLRQPVAGDENYIAPVAAFPETALGLIVVRIDHVLQIARDGVADLHRVEALDIIRLRADRIHNALGKLLTVIDVRAE